MKKFILGFLCGVLVWMGSVIANELNVIKNPYPVKVNGVEKDVTAYIINDRTYMPLRELGDILNVNVDFKDDIIIIGEENRMINTTNSERIIKDGIEVYTVNGIEYMWMNDIGSKLKDLVSKLPPLEEMPYIIHEDKTSIPYTYYVEHIKPLLK